MFLPDYGNPRDPGSDDAPALRWQAEVYEGDEA
ncbi:hypothetical protein M878_21640 [Streptomyces roseochromogenus subsp. oscitans DS 12.976]|uniref:Uncharacterized protein n=1 Tax=Streptomyces roseochromogenus subsp. oscitans DS 12.976 TaxID=1352936 RepID=V6KAD0_STRRC|nr:hypothetical protein M878_21640 [Streptomyces roseochromogenus subsp. oscitans DS 12.976]